MPSAVKTNQTKKSFRICPIIAPKTIPKKQPQPSPITYPINPDITIGMNIPIEYHKSSPSSFIKLEYSSSDNSLPLYHLYPTLINFNLNI